MNYPDWIYEPAVKFKSGQTKVYPVTDIRLEDRKAIFDIVKKNPVMLICIDKIIDYFRNKYENSRREGGWTGLGKRQRVKLFIEKKGKCHWCNKSLSLNNFTVEHIIPLIEGGESDWKNLSIACSECNTTREGINITKEGYFKEKL